jgi:hypothetical protein
MRACTIPVAITLALAPAPALPFDHGEFCAAVTDVARRMNARSGRWLDRSTRYDGVELDCDAKILEAKRFVNADPDEMREGWESGKQREWNAHYCNLNPGGMRSTMAGASSRRSRSERANRSRLSRSVSDTSNPAFAATDAPS